MFCFRPRYLIVFLLLLCIEIGIALFVHDQFVRPWLVDFLVMPLVYCALRSVLNIRIPSAALGSPAIDLHAPLLETPLPGAICWPIHWLQLLLFGLKDAPGNSFTQRHGDTVNTGLYGL